MNLCSTFKYKFLLFSILLQPFTKNFINKEKKPNIKYINNLKCREYSSDEGLSRKIQVSSTASVSSGNIVEPNSEYFIVSIYAGKLT